MVALSRGKVYDVLSVEKGWYRIMTEIGEDYLFPPREFEQVEDIPEGNAQTSVLQNVVYGLLEHARGVATDADPRKEPQYHAGRCMGCYEMLDILKAELNARQMPLKDLGLDVDLEEILLSQSKEKR